jgi:hypothetical protein
MVILASESIFGTLWMASFSHITVIDHLLALWRFGKSGQKALMDICLFGNWMKAGVRDGGAMWVRRRLNMGGERRSLIL